MWTDERSDQDDDDPPSAPIDAFLLLLIGKDKRTMSISLSGSSPVDLGVPRRRSSPALSAPYSTAFRPPAKRERCPQTTRVRGHRYRFVNGPFGPMVIVTQRPRRLLAPRRQELLPQQQGLRQQERPHRPVPRSTAPTLPGLLTERLGRSSHRRSCRHRRTHAHRSAPGTRRRRCRPRQPA